MTEWLRLEGTPEITGFQTLSQQGHQPPVLGLEQAAHGLIQPGPEENPQRGFVIIEYLQEALESF